MSEKHTPGKWYWDTMPEELVGEGDIETGKLDHILRVVHGYGPSNADKALIASAPDLLAENAKLREQLWIITGAALDLINEIEVYGVPRVDENDDLHGDTVFNHLKQLVIETRVEPNE